MLQFIGSFLLGVCGIGAQSVSAAVPGEAAPDAVSAAYAQVAAVVQEGAAEARLAVEKEAVPTRLCVRHADPASETDAEYLEVALRREFAKTAEFLQERGLKLGEGCFLVTSARPDEEFVEGQPYTYSYQVGVYPDENITGAPVARFQARVVFGEKPNSTRIAFLGWQQLEVGHADGVDETAAEYFESALRAEFPKTAEFLQEKNLRPDDVFFFVTSAVLTFPEVGKPYTYAYRVRIYSDRTMKGDPAASFRVSVRFDGKKLNTSKITKLRWE